MYFYSNSSGNVRSFAHRLERPVYDIGQRAVRTSVPETNYVLIMPLYAMSDPAADAMPKSLRRFMRSPLTRRRLLGVMSSGESRFDESHQAACRELARCFHRPVLFEFDMQGTRWDVVIARAILAELDDAAWDAGVLTREPASTVLSLAPGVRQT
ncbi:class Ib ribonucleoside-diphosphate reductase assembly flavoprotein NrdI [Microbacterium halophytorum]|uniref:class Ib ribonucleoside-diphosphate reductase assembly flavoprotein NrdI n=1 Tax=Microbacterium halophytorum TaxID=2067568 RepID=UPI001E4E4FF1|nr:class Ib ribonucleoside-diphosphate reductase assembly flavoprotein NrdI [Microbacterium halophytorum]